MTFSVLRENLLAPLQMVTGVVEKRQTLPILSNILIDADDRGLSLTGSDQEVELVVTLSDYSGRFDGPMTLPARKLLDICRSLPDGTELAFEPEGPRVLVSSGRFKSHLGSLPAEEFPCIDMAGMLAQVSIGTNALSRLLNTCSFAMAQQDVRYFFNGMLVEIDTDGIRTVATNGQRMATSWFGGDMAVDARVQVIIPRKGVTELCRLLSDAEGDVDLSISANHLQASVGGGRLTTKLIDASYPDYTRAIPAAGDKLLVGDRLEIREALRRTAILSNEMYRNVHLALSPGNLRINANNPLQEEAEENVGVDYQGAELEIGFNVGYLIDVLGVMGGDRVQMKFSDGASAGLFLDETDPDAQFVVSPMML